MNKQYKKVKYEGFKSEDQGFSVPDPHWLFMKAIKLGKGMGIGEDNFIFKTASFTSMLDKFKDGEVLTENSYPIPDPTHLWDYCKANGIPIEQVHDVLLENGEAIGIIGRMMIEYRLVPMSKADNLRHKG